MNYLIVDSIDYLHIIEDVRTPEEKEKMRQSSRRLAKMLEDNPVKFLVVDERETRRLRKIVWHTI